MAHRLLPTGLVGRWWCVGCRLVVAVLVMAGTAGAVEVTSHADGKGRVLHGPSLPVARSAGACVVEKVELVAHPAPGIRLRLSRAAALRVRTLRPDRGAPPRIYVDVPGSALDPRVPRSIAGADPIVRVRSGQFDPRTARIIIDLAREETFTLAQDGKSATISIGGAAVAHTSGPGAPRPKVVADTAQRAGRVGHE